MDEERSQSSDASSASKVEDGPATMAGNAVGGISDGKGEPTMSQLERITTGFGARPECFKNTLQEVAFVTQATVATASSAFLSGTALIITVPVSMDLHMTQGQISWISASTSYVAPLFFSLSSPLLWIIHTFIHTYLYM